jgi:ATP-dependent Clp protease ATP-binding subunit ClpA
VFETFTERGRQVIVLAQEEARRLQHNYVGTEHFLLGLLREEEGVGARVLESMGVTLQRVRAQVVAIVGMGEEASGGPIPFTPRAKKVLELSLRECQSLGLQHIDTEHILLALSRERGGVAARILLDFDADPGAIADEVGRMLSGAGPVRRRLQAPAIEAWLEGLSPHTDRLGGEIHRKLDRYPDSGDLLLALACTQETLAGQVLNELGIGLDALQTAIERARTGRGHATDEIDRRTGEVRQAKEQAVQAGDFEAAARLRDRERELSAQPRAAQLIGPEALDEFRRRAGLPGDP